MSADARAVNNRRADTYVSVPGDHQDIVDVDDLAGVHGQGLDANLVSRLNAVLLAARLDNRIRIQRFTYSTHKDRGRLNERAPTKKYITGSVHWSKRNEFSDESYLVHTSR